jgi:two-component SAPR family response regulator
MSKSTVRTTNGSVPEYIIPDEDYYLLEARARWAEDARAVLEDVSSRLFSMPQLRALLAAYPQPVQESVFGKAVIEARQGNGG